MKFILCILLLFLSGCVSVPIPPVGDRVGELGTLKLSLKVAYEPKSSPERPPSDSMAFAWEQFGLTQPKLLKDK
jgi:hypothetical protein